MVRNDAEKEKKEVQREKFSQVATKSNVKSLAKWRRHQVLKDARQVQ